VHLTNYLADIMAHNGSQWPMAAILKNGHHRTSDRQVDSDRWSSVVNCTYYCMLRSVRHNVNI